MNVQNVIKAKLQTEFKPHYLAVLNESDSHSVPPNSETHFKVTLVSTLFSATRQVQRHQMIYRLLAEELAGPVHALALHTYSPEEWQARGGQSPLSPDCLGGSKT